MSEPEETYKTYVVRLQADGGRRVRYYAYAATPERAKALACAAELAPLSAVRSVQVSDFERAGR
jgi:hypothetical protein